MKVGYIVTHEHKYKFAEGSLKEVFLTKTCAINYIQKTLSGEGLCQNNLKKDWYNDYYFHIIKVYYN